MPRRPKQLDLPIREKFEHGGRRKGAGRPKSSDFQSHVARTPFQARHPLHVNIGLTDELAHLDRREIFRALRAAVSQARKGGLKIAHFIILSNHLHFIIEAEGKDRLSQVMQSLGVSFAKRLNAKLKRKGAVLRERYHVHILKTPSEVKRALNYVLSNEYKHQGKKGWIARNIYSSAVIVAKETWRALLGKDWQKMLDPRDDDGREASLRIVQELITEPKTWLLKEGWQRAKAA